MNYEKELSNIENSISDNLCRLRMFGEGSTVYADENENLCESEHESAKEMPSPPKKKRWHSDGISSWALRTRSQLLRLFYGR